MVSDRLARRVVTPDVAPADGRCCALVDLRPGECGTVRDVGGDADPACVRRLVDLGFGPGEQVQVVRRAPLADPVVFRVAGYEVALRRAQARCIQVVVLS